MTDLSRTRGVYGNHYDRYISHSDSSTLTRVQQQYWATKQAVYRKLGKKEDDCIIASDAELDSKLQLFEAISETCNTLMRVLENYQDRICALSQEENAMGRFLKECGKHDKTRAGKMMTSTGKTLSYTAQQRLSLRVPLVRIYQEVETFNYRAVADTLLTVEKMEKSRNTYRGALMWMKDVSQQLDPDTYKQLEKFRKVQSYVKKTKTRFDKMKVDTLQKVDLLSASRCNMLSLALATYQCTLLQFWEKTSHTMSAVAESFKGYQHYEFSMLKELTEPSKKLAEETSNSEKPVSEENNIDTDQLLFFESEYHDEEEENKEISKNLQKKHSNLQGLLSSPKKEVMPPEKNHKFSSSQELSGIDSTENTDSNMPLLKLSEETHTHAQSIHSHQTESAKEIKAAKGWQKDFLTDNPEIEDSEKDDLTLLNEILNASKDSLPLIPNSSENEDSFSHQWQAAFGNTPQSPQKSFLSIQNNEMDQFGHHQSNGTGACGILPSQLLDMTTDISNLHLKETAVSSALDTCMESQIVPLGSKQESHGNHNIAQSATSRPVKLSTSEKRGLKQDMSAWFNLFADLDPLANPDAVGKKDGEVEERNC
ncbi:islet cell autoantigen 1-like isoform X1 [Limulus polyphemus]|uniref:Islet cell autoantigen 1-like isoform X1 n=1 Tax=Limulus polyphemus TaxID=6850 RepID=A0ABM1BMP2_LIMPO|nr:islet cell autoantigen 1-like isoform X1 [Limulus polyphemus]XP_022253321.1 islet cell autoantigen 1-like isoform X1 [Limulus polyphemus]